MQTKVFDMAGKQVGEIELSDAIFGIEPNEAVVHDVVKNHLANCRQGTQSSLTRAEVSGGGIKPWRQKGTGRARQGSIRAPQWTHGGIVFAPKPRDYSYTLNKKVKRLALKSVLSAKAQEENIVVIDEIKLDAIKTKPMASFLKAVGADTKALVVTAENNEVVVKSAANIPGVLVTFANLINVYDILNAKTKAAGQQVSESDTETEIGMNPPEVRAGDEYETPHPEGITSICYSCTEYETCNVKTGTCTSCDQYKNRTEAYKTDEQRYSEEQDAIDRETKKKLREMEQEEKMQKLPSTAPEEIKTIRVSQDKFEEYTGEYRKPYMITKDDGFKVGNVVKLVVFAAGKATGETADMRITCKDDDITCSGLSDGWCVIGLGEA